MFLTLVKNNSQAISDTIINDCIKSYAMFVLAKNSVPSYNLAGFKIMEESGIKYIYYASEKEDVLIGKLTPYGNSVIAEMKYLNHEKVDSGDFYFCLN